MGEFPTVTARAYVAACAALALAGFALIATLGLVVDAYGVFGTRLIPASRFPPNLRLTRGWDRVTKAIEIAERQGDKILFVGDSRTQLGLDPDAPALAGVKAYNAALVGATLAEQIVSLDYSLAHEPGIRRIVWGLSYEEFAFGIFTWSDYEDSAFAGRGIVSGLLRHLFAHDRVMSSWKALLQARRLVRATMKRNGVATFSGDPVEGPAIARLFESELKGMSHNILAPRPRQAMDEAHDKLRRRLAELKAAGFDVDLVIVPLHIWRLEFFWQTGVDIQADAWKRRIAATVEGLATAPGSGKLRFFDFARPHPFVEQPVYAPPPPGERRYYLESSHFYPWLGDKVLATVFGNGEGPEAMPGTEPFGREIGRGANSISIDGDIAMARAALDRWESTHEDEVSHIRKLILR
ncbi:MAG: hypothetical protein ACHQAY_12390 [Hyphomicrobiales bacterium]